MKKILMFLSVLILGLSLTGCDLFGSEVTTVTTEAIVVDTENYIDVSTVSELQAMEFNKSYKLVADIDLTDVDWTPLGDYYTPFMGNFDGNNHTISNLSMTASQSLYNGLFGKITGDVFDVELSGFSIIYETDTMNYIGLLAGYTLGNVTNVTISSGTIDVNNNQSNTYLGLLVGSSQAPVNELSEATDFVPNSISDNFVSGTITLDSNNIATVGGMIGKTFNSTVSDNYSNVTMTVSLQDYAGFIGGFIGKNNGGILNGYEELVEDANVYIENNVVISDITVTVDNHSVSIGGFIGYNTSGYNRDNYAKTNITVSGSTVETTVVTVGGYIGANWNSVVENTVSIFSYTSTIASTFIENTSFIYIGADYSDEDTSVNYVASLLEDIDVSTVPGLTEISDTDYESSSFYQDTLSWTTEQINKILN